MRQRRVKCPIGRDTPEGVRKAQDAVTVSPSQVEKVKQYVLNQEQHHRKKDVKEEYVELLKLAGVDYDEKYLW